MVLKKVKSNSAKLGQSRWLHRNSVQAVELSQWSCKPNCIDTSFPTNGDPSYHFCTSRSFESAGWLALLPIKHLYGFARQSTGRVLNRSALWLFKKYYGNIVIIHLLLKESTLYSIGHALWKKYNVICLLWIMRWDTSMTLDESMWNGAFGELSSCIINNIPLDLVL